VFEAVSTTKGLRGWFTDDVAADTRVGGVVELGFNKHTVVFRMEVAELERPQRLIWKCVGGPDEWVGTTLTFELAAAPRNACRARFTHAGWASVDGEFALCNTTWGHLMHLLKAYAEGRAPGPLFKN
jgi:uncharacterized protein YndB with AHSA1/START domain